MVVALGYEFEIVRVVLENDVNDIYIYKYMKEQTQHFCTCIRVKESRFQKHILLTLVENKEVQKNMDYIGHFVQEGALNLLFHYHEEKKLETYIDLCAATFEKKNNLCKNLVALCQSLHFPQTWICLLLKEDNMHMNEAGEVYFNYFMDFSTLSRYERDKACGFNQLAQQIFDILSRDFNEITELEKYPTYLKLFYKKMIYEGFKGYNEFYEYLGMMPKVLKKEKGALEYIKETLLGIIEKLKRYVPTVTLIALVIFSLYYSVDQLKLRHQQEIANAKTQEEAKVYKKLYQIGNVEVHQADGVGE